MRPESAPIDPAHLNYLRRRLLEVGFWFIDIPRTSSTTIKAALAARHGKLFGKRGVRQGVARGLVADHTPARELRALLGPDAWSRIRSLCVVRDPWARTLSLYLYRRQIGGEELPEFDAYVERLRAAVEAEADGESEARWRPDLDPLFRYHGFRWSGCRYICDVDGDFLVDAIVRYEDRDRELARVARAWQAPALTPSRRRIGATAHDAYERYYSARSRDAIAHAYRDDVERFEYRFRGTVLA